MLSIHSDDHFMRVALKQAMLAGDSGEIPVGAVVVADRQIIAKAHNQTERLSDPTAHAEMIAITAACNYLGTKYLNECTLYVTLEPCCMCGGALYWSQIGKVIYAACDDRRGYRAAAGHILHPKTVVESGLMADEAGALVTGFFEKLRGR